MKRAELIAQAEALEWASQFVPSDTHEFGEIWGRRAMLLRQAEAEPEAGAVEDPEETQVMASLIENAQFVSRRGPLGKAEPEAVAWEYRYIQSEEGPGLWQPCSSRDMPYYKARPAVWEVRALYTAPPADRARELLTAALEHMDARNDDVGLGVIRQRIAAFLRERS